MHTQLDGRDLSLFVFSCVGTIYVLYINNKTKILKKADIDGEHTTQYLLYWQVAIAFSFFYNDTGTYVYYILCNTPITTYVVILQIIYICIVCSTAVLDLFYFLISCQLYILETTTTYCCCSRRVKVILFETSWFSEYYFIGGTYCTGIEVRQYEQALSNFPSG